MDPSRDRGDEAVNWVTAWQVTARSCMSVQVAKALGVSHQAIHGMLRTALKQLHGQHKPALQALLATMT